jgi:hypothetical protein
MFESGKLAGDFPAIPSIELTASRISSTVPECLTDNAGRVPYSFEQEVTL